MEFNPDNHQLRYPVRTVMKIITDMPDSRHDQRLRLESVFNTLLLAPKEWKHRISGKQKYMSFTTTVYIQNREQMYTLYEKLQELPEVKRVL
ncbi:MAG: DUF493 domain-containing protein [Spirochaetia bacterium]